MWLNEYHFYGNLSEPAKPDQIKSNIPLCRCISKVTGRIYINEGNYRYDEFYPSVNMSG